METIEPSQSLTNIFRKIKSARPFILKIGDLVPEKQCTQWYEVISQQDFGVRAGIIEEGYWIIWTAEGLKRIKDSESCYFLFPVLEKNVQKLHEEFINKHLDIESIKTFPIKEIIQATISQRSPYWLDLALPWYNLLADKEKAWLKNELMELAGNRR